MLNSTSVLGACFDAMRYSGAAALARPFLAGHGAIFCLHHVLPGGGLQNGFAPNAKLEITPDFLRQIIGLVQAAGYECLSIGAALERLKSGKADRPFAVFTLDDGYRDNLEHAYPVFKKFNCPFTICVSPRIADGTCELWWRGLEVIIAAQSHVNFDISGQKIIQPTETDQQKWQAWNTALPLLQSMPEHDQRHWIRRNCESVGIDLNAMCRKAAMTWDEIRSINRDPLTTIGAHTLNHHNLMRLELGEAKREIRESGQRIAEELGEPTRHFAYPYGNVDAAGPREFALCAAAGYASSVTTRLGNVLPAHREHMQALPRIMVSGRFQNPRYISTLMSGLPGFLFNRGKRVHVA